MSALAERGRGRSRGPAGGLLAAAAAVILALTASTPIRGVAQQQIPGFSPEQSRVEARYEDQFLASTDPVRIFDYHEYLARSPAEEGTPGAWRRVQYIESELESYGLEVDIETFYAYMVDPREVQVSVEMLAPSRLSLAVKESPRPWHERFDEISVGFSEGTPSGDVTAEAVYANYGRAEDYELLEERGVSVEGRIALVRHGGMQRGEKPYQAHVHGAAGLIMYSDPADDGNVRGSVYPEGPWRAPDCIERGTVNRWTVYAGDPLTPGWAATKHAPRIPVEESNIGQIPPTTSIGYGAAQPLLENLQGPVAPDGWQGGLPFPYRLGGPGSTTVRLQVDAQYEPRAAWNVIARIPGDEYPDEMVVIGTHYDTWAYGARDNTAGVATTLEMARGLGVLLDAGWRPKRTLLVVFFGAEDRGIVGSTEFTELLGAGMQRVVAFVNPAHLAGSRFRGSAVPALDEFLLDATRRVEWGQTGTTIHDHWAGSSESGQPQIGRLGGGTDHMSFLDRFGIPVISIGARSDDGRYHSICDDFRALREFDDPGMYYQAAMSQLSGLLGVRLAGADILPLRYSRYAEEISEDLRDFAEIQRTELGRIVVDVDRDIEQAGAWRDAARTFEAMANERLASGQNAASFVPLNRALMRVERSLLSRRGLPGRAWYLHQIYAPQFHNGFAVRKLPGLYDALFIHGDVGDASAYESELFDSLSEATRVLEEALR